MSDKKRKKRQKQSSAKGRKEKQVVSGGNITRKTQNHQRKRSSLEKEIIYVDKKFFVQPEEKETSVKKRYSRMGIHSLCYTAVAFFCFAAAIGIAFFMHGQAQKIVGGLGACAILLSSAGIWAGVKGMKEKNRRYLNCWIGICGAGIMLAGLIFLFAVGYKAI